MDEYRVHWKNKSCYDNAPESSQEHKEQDTEDIEGENQPENKEQDNEQDTEDSEDENQPEKKEQDNEQDSEDDRNEPVNDNEQTVNIEVYISSEKNGSIASYGSILTVQFIAFHPDFIS